MANTISGLHLVVDGLVSNIDCFDRQALEKFVRDLAINLDMTLIFGPIFVGVPVHPENMSGDTFRDEGGTSGFAMVNKSHISIHVWPLRKCFMLDICSCEHFDAEIAMKTIHDYLEPSSVRVKSVTRDQIIE